MGDRSEHRDLEGQGDGAGEEDKDASCFHNPILDKKTLLEHLPVLAMATLLGVTAINVLTSNQSLSGDTNKHKGLKQFLLALPYTMFLFAFAGLAVAFAVKRKPRVLGCATGTLLVQLVCLVVMGGMVKLVHADVDPRIIWSLTGVIVVIVLVVWSVLCAYPKVDPDLTNSEKKCDTCGGLITDNGRSANPAAEGAQRCESCGGARGDGTRCTPPGIVSV